ncbi:MAG TPA: peptide chain release factor N(5)-glutamine methyltransferase [Bacteroidales bacterium]|nr:peptide chain release factor N(5)-glutamine methyltransferase [Bacteroidales bacterium]HPR57564.1 peptide chain release factor N(5)-glutamine methyltransferase [Bacteroidales bacterium]HRW96739.1 peptide chain release factor N(5)-glutamine methyltransferase [Bacteroidales bacterium]
MNFTTNKIRDIRETYLKELKKLYPENESAAFLDLIIEKRLGINRLKRLSSPDLRISESEILKIHFDVRELKKHRPIQYILGESQFLDLNLMVNENVLIPRPETEELVLWIVENEKPKKNLFILDIGTGSGCIALSLKQLIPESKIWACDLSEEALKVASQNATKNHLEVNFFKTNILQEVIPDLLPSLDIIVSNPPYVTEAEKAQMQFNVLDFEPPDALFVKNEDPLIYYRNICRLAASKLKPGGRLYFEINQKYGKEVTDIMKSAGFKYPVVKKDIFDKNRMVSATWL